MLKGRLLAWNPVTQEPAWSHEHGGPWNGGVLSTSGNLVFQGTADAHFAAYNARTGEKKWQFFTQTGVVPAPITYELDGDQYVAVAAGWGGSYVLGFGGVMPTGSVANIGRVMVFKLGADSALPAVPETSLADKSVPAMLDVSEEVIKQGMQLYTNACTTCHGDQAFSSGLIPNLRYSPYTKSAEAFNGVVLGGALASQGMPNFGEVISAEQLEAIRAYIIAEANSGRNEEFYKTVTD